MNRSTPTDFPSFFVRKIALTHSPHYKYILLSSSKRIYHLSFFIYHFLSQNKDLQKRIFQDQSKLRLCIPLSDAYLGVSLLHIFDKSPIDIYLLKVNNKITRSRCEICSKLTINTLERHHWLLEHIEHILQLVLVFLLLTLSM